MVKFSMMNVPISSKRMYTGMLMMTVGRLRVPAGQKVHLAQFPASDTS